MKNFISKILYCRRRGVISLAEIVAAMIIASIIALAVMMVYSRANSAADSMERLLAKNDAGINIFQRIAEDIDRIATAGTDAILTVKNKFDHGYNICQLTIESRIFDKDQKPQTFEKIVWQSQYDVDANGIVLYRAHSGMVPEDKVLDELDDQLTKWKGRELFIPLCQGLTYFKIEIPKDAKFVGLLSEKEKLQDNEVEMLDKWDSEKLPNAVRISLSFAPIVKSSTGGFDVADEDKIFRTVAVDRIRKIAYKFVKKTFDIPKGEVLPDDVNDLETEPNDVNDAQSIEDDKR